MNRGTRTLLALGLLGLVVFGCGKDGPEQVEDPEFVTESQFVSDSLGIALTLPESPGWSFEKDPPIREGSYLSANHESDDASFKLFVNPVDAESTLDDVVAKRKDRLAALFGVNSLDQVISRIMRDERRAVDGQPVMQWQAVTDPVARAGGDPARVIIMWLATIRSGMAYECIGLVFFPLQPTEDQRAVTDALLQDVAFILESLNVR